MDQEKVAKFIKKLRKDNNLTQKDLADRYKVTYQAVSKWERGLNLPDTSLLKQMSKDFNISIDDILEGEFSKKKNNIKIMYIISITIVIIALIIAIIFINFTSNNSDDFHFKTLSSNCKDFNISGTIAYNDSKSAIYITNIKYCGGDDNEEYKEVECALYESDNDIEKKISSYKYDKDKNINLEDFLQQVTLTVDNYTKVCKEYKDNSLYLTINATNKEDKVITYKIPLVLNESCTTD